ncbi:MAG: HlyC/CorC family transporter [Verrucomicrobiae bacterium]|nr:HlyC/CorC family transporter [Verrucomicrobiae bacterium]
MSPVVSIALLAACLLLSFLFSGMETGLLSLNRFRLRQLMRSGDRRARLLNRYLADPEPLLWTILVGNTVANMGAAVLVLSGVHDRWPGEPIVFAGAALALAVVLFGLCEIVPKTLFGIYPNRLCLFLVRPFRFLKGILSPLVMIVELVAGLMLRGAGGRAFAGSTFANREELRWLMQESGQGFTTEERAMISRVMDLEKLTVRSQMVPWSKVVSVEATASMDELMAKAREHRHTRMPVWEGSGSGRSIAGLISLKRLLFDTTIDSSKKADDYTTPALFVDESKRLEDALQLLQKTGHRMAVVQDRRKRPIGIVCLEDILSVIFGEVRL